MERLKTKKGKEPHIVTCLTDSDGVANNYIVGDSITVCEISSVSKTVLILLALYFLLDLNFPPEYSQILGLIQMLCLDIDFPHHLRSSAFTTLKETLC